MEKGNKIEVGIIAFDMIVLGIACIMVKAEWLIPVRKYLMLALLCAGIGLSALAVKEIDFGLSIFLGIFAAFWFFLLLWAVFRKNEKTEEILYIPEGSYQITAVDRTGAPSVQMAYCLMYQGKVYTLSTMPPEGTPALILYAKPQENSDVILADISIDTSRQPPSARQRLEQIHGGLVLIAALLLPVFYEMYKGGSITENLLPYCIMILLGYLGSKTTKGSKSVLNSLIFWFAVFLEAAGWVRMLAGIV